MKLHQIISLLEAFNSLSTEISQMIKSNLLEKKEILTAQIYRIEYRIEEIRNVKKAIERDVRKEYSETLEKLKSNEGEKVAILEKELADLQEDLNILNDLGMHFIEMSTNNSDPFYFMLNSRNLYEKMIYLVSKPFKTIIDVYPNDLPRDLTDKRLELEKIMAFKEIISFKDELIVMLKNLKEEKLKKRKEELGKAGLDMINLATRFIL